MTMTRDEKYNRLERDLLSVVQIAIWNGVTPEEFKSFTAELWQYALDAEKRKAAESFAR